MFEFCYKYILTVCCNITILDSEKFEKSIENYTPSVATTLSASILNDEFQDVPLGGTTTTEETI